LKALHLLPYKILCRITLSRIYQQRILPLQFIRFRERTVWPSQGKMIDLATFYECRIHSNNRKIEQFIVLFTVAEDA
ncbi:hypothetical protein, partial [Pseudomonas viridiflava]|uniref:hypothetical protein n=1 Tax=Pseudomonas viridiflava TaxID=33069 RepID=UPI0013DFC892